MAKYNFSMRLNEQSIKQLEKELRNYKQNILRGKIQKFVDELLSVGISTAYLKVNQATDFEKKHYVNYISFSKKVVYDDKETLIVYLVGEGEMQGEVKPLSMMEWGSALHALPVEQAYGGFGGKGTFATTGANLDKESWHYQDAEGNWKTNHSVKPQRPMYSASVTMKSEILRIARRVFG